MNPFDYEPTAPHSVESEQSVLGALMQSNAALDRIAGEISEQDFYRADHRSIWRQITRLIDANKPADVVTVAEGLELTGELDQCGGLAYLAAVTQNTPSAANIRRYAEIVRERALLRALQEAGNQVLAAVAAPAGRTAAEIAAEAERALSAFAADRGTGEPRTAADAMGDLLRDIDNPATRHGLKTGIEDFDALTGGLLPGQLHIVAARPSVGKSALALAKTRHVADQVGQVAFFSLEMSESELAARLLAADTGITLRDLRAGPSEMQYQQLAAALARWSKRGLTIDDQGGVSLAYVRARCRRLARDGGLSLIVIDYLQLMQPADTRASRTEQVGSLSRGLKALAKELHVPIIALAQLNRAAETRADKKPQLSDLRDSGEVEQDADSVLLLSRATDDGDVLCCDLAKHRQGPRGTFYLDFNGASMRLSKRTSPPPVKAIARPTRAGFDE